jgi:hypothetical protein
MKSNMAKRVGFAVVAIPVVLSLVWYGGLPLALLVAAAGWLGAGELLGFARRQQVRPWSPAVHLLAGILPLVGWAVMVQPETRDGLQAQWPFIAGAWVLVVSGAAPAERGGHHPAGTPLCRWIARIPAGDPPCRPWGTLLGGHRAGVLPDGDRLDL